MDKLEDLYRQLSQRSGCKHRLEEIRAIDTQLGSPSGAITTIHIAGTNGKGSVATKIAHTLTELGFKTGLYTSPHLSTFRERIQIDGEMINEEFAYEELSHLLGLSDELSFFEVLTLLGFIYFARSNVDYAVIETGMGGVMDATNIVKPILSIITNVEKDHIQSLGPTLDDVALNKAGIIKSRTPVVLGHRAARKVVIQDALSKRAPIYFVREQSNYVKENEAIAKRALDYIVHATPYNLSKEVPPCRLEVQEVDGKNVIFDVAHNPDALKKLYSEITHRFGGQDIYTLFGISQGKECGQMLSIIERASIDLHYVECDHPRLIGLSQIKEYMPDINHQTLDEFLSDAFSRDGIILIVGSFFIMDYMKQKLGFSLTRDLLTLCD